MSRPFRFVTVVVLVLIVPLVASAQPYGPPDRGAPGDEMIQAYLAREEQKLSAGWAEDVKSLAEWEKKRPQYVEEYFYMLGLAPRPEKTKLKATVTGTVRVPAEEGSGFGVQEGGGRQGPGTGGQGYVVENLHYQSVPGLYVTGNLYRPATVKEGEKLPAVFYVCGHSGRGRNGNKVAYQSHGIWFARHGYICLVVDTLQLGEIAAFHHGTYNLGRWWWHSRGYTPAGVEAWNGVRGIDYLVSRADVDPERIAVTGISGGGAATFWVAAADERVKVAVPVSGMADLESYVSSRVINGHCDCMFLYNTFRWPWTRIAGLVAPRPMLFVNSDQDRIFPMDANERIQARLERLYSLHGAGDRVDAVVSVGGHAYRQDIRQAAYRFINAHLKGDARPITDSEVDIVSEGRDPGPYPIPPEKLRVFPTDADLPRDELNTKIDEHFVPIAKVESPKAGEFDSWKKSLVAELKRVSFGYFPDSIPAAKKVIADGTSTRFAGAPAPTTDGSERVESEEGIEFRLVRVQGSGFRVQQGKVDKGERILLAVLNEDEAGKTPEWLSEAAGNEAAIVLCEPRGIGATRWTRKNGPNYVERSHALLGRTVDAGRVWDVIAAAKYLREGSRQGGFGVQGSAESGVRGRESAVKMPVFVVGKGAAGLIGAYAAVLDDVISGVTLIAPSVTHMDNAAPQFLNVLRVCDVPSSLGLIAPRRLTITGSSAERFLKTRAAYEAVGEASQLVFK